MLLSKWNYYLHSIPTLLFQMKDPLQTIKVFLGLQNNMPFLIQLRSGLRFKVRTAMDVWVIKEACLDKDYEKYGSQVQDGWSVIDIGAGIGDFSIYVAARNKNSKLYAFEPFPESFRLLNENLSLNRISNVQAFQQAVGMNGHIELNTNSNIPVLYSTANQSDGGKSNAVLVSSTTLDKLFEDLALEQCDFMKMDCEGAEYAIFFNTSEDTMRKIERVSLEYHDNVTRYSHTDLIQFFQRNGFKVRQVTNPVHKTTGFLYAYR